MTRRDRIHGIAAGLGQPASAAATKVRAREPMRLPLELAQAADAFVQAADRLAALAEQEIRFLEEARDFEGGEG